VPLELIRRSGAAAVSLDLTLVDQSSAPALDALGTVLDAGLGLWAGVVPSTDSVLPSAPGQEADHRGGDDRGADQRGRDQRGDRRGGDQPGAVLSGPGATVTAIRTLWQRLGFSPESLGGVVVTPTCGLAAASPAYARAALERCRAAARTLVDDPEGERALR
jgi:hypothetical protein